MISVYDSKDECCGCEGCRQICPRNCISMVEDANGFIYPVIDQTSCIDCGACRKVCAYHNAIPKYENNNCYAYIHHSTEYRIKSASSGAFEILCRAFVDRNVDSDLVIFGCEMDEQFTIRHNYSMGLMDIDKYKKSKYVQSRIGDTYLQVKKFLQDGKKVVFSGTPCQIMGLKLFLKKEYSNLLLIDILCHGVPNQRTFNKYIEYLKHKYKSKVIHYTFRYKIKDKPEKGNLNTNITLNNGRNITLNCSEDMFMRPFLAGMFNRDSCQECPFATTGRVSDITMGDFWGIDNYNPQYSELITNGTSLIMFNSEKGKVLKDLVARSGVLQELPLSAAIPYNGQLTHPEKFNAKRQQFFSNLSKRNGYKKALSTVYPQEFGRKAVLLNSIYSSRIYQLLHRIKRQISK